MKKNKNHGVHGVTRSFDTTILYSSVKLQAVQRTAVLRGKILLSSGDKA